MRLNFLLRPDRKDELAEKQREATIVHRNNIKSIVQSRQSANRLKEALEQNNIIIEIAGAIGHS